MLHTNSRLSPVSLKSKGHFFPVKVCDMSLQVETLEVTLFREFNSDGLTFERRGSRLGFRVKAGDNRESRVNLNMGRAICFGSVSLQNQKSSKVTPKKQNGLWGRFGPLVDGCIDDTLPF